MTQFIAKALKGGLAIALATVVTATSSLGAVSAAAGEGAETLGSPVGLKNGKIVVVVDPGHDYEHIGAQREPLIEEELNLKIAQALYNKLSESPYLEVHMTRYDNKCPYTGLSSSGECLRRRVNTAASYGADLYVATHLNIARGVTRGAEVYYPNSGYNPVVGDTGRTVSKNILKELVKLGLIDRGAKTKDSNSGTYDDGSAADYYSVIYNSKLKGFAGIIVEHCFMDNPEDVAQFLSTDEDIKKLGEADADGILASLDDIRDAATNYYDGVFDASYYRERYTDVAEQFLPEDSTGMLEHFLNVGMDEGRVGDPDFDVMSYYLANPDLRKAFGKKWRKYFEHYLNYGRFEDRACKDVTDMAGATTVYKGVDYSDVYDFNYYEKQNPDIKEVLGYNDELVIAHFVNAGMDEKRRASKDFDVISYFNAYPDLRAAYGKKWKNYYEHYRKFGKSENRVATGVTERRGYKTKLGDTDYAAVYDYNYYLNNYPDLKAALGDSETTVLEHFVKFGMNEARTASESFNVREYAANYADLRNIFGDNMKEYYLHYINYGQREGRAGTAQKPDTSDTPDTPDAPSRPVYDESTFTTIMGSTGTTIEQMMTYFYFKNAEYPEYYMYSDAPTLYEFCEIYIEEAEAEGVRPEVAFAQAMLETNFLRYTGAVQLEQFNFAGLGALAGGVVGEVYPDVRTGIRAHIQHLKAYGSTDSLYYPQVDTRFGFVERGVSKYVEYLGIQENPMGKGWATSSDYGFNIMASVRELLSM